MTTIYVNRDKAGKPRQAIDIVDSPDDGGYYLSATDFAKRRKRVSQDIYPSFGDAMRAYSSSKVRWEAWYG